MTYVISAGLSEVELTNWLRNAAKKYGTFEDGRVDYTKAPIAPIVMCTITCDDEIFLAKRGYGLADAEGYWSTVNGFIDEVKRVKQQAQQEVKEELGITITLQQIRCGKSYTLQNPKEKRQYIVFPCHVSLPKKPTITLDSEHTKFAWIKREALNSYHILDDLPYAVDAALKV